MVDIYKAGQIPESAFRLRDTEAQVTERNRLIEALRHGNIHEVLAKTSPVLRSDIERFFSDQWKSFKGQILQDTDIKASEAACPEPDIKIFPMHHKNVTLSPQDTALYTQELMNFINSSAGGAGGQGAGSSASDGGAQSSGGSASGGGGTPYSGIFKAQTTGKATTSTSTTGTTSSADAGTPMTADQVQQATQGTISDVQNFFNDNMGTLMDGQFKLDYEKQMGQVKEEVQRILAMVKSGQIGAEWALIALTKMNQTKNGCIMTHLGTELASVNDQMNSAYTDLSKMSASDASYFSTLQSVQNKTRDGSFQMNLLQTDMQKVMQDAQSTMEFAKSFLDQYSKHKQDIVALYRAQA